MVTACSSYRILNIERPMQGLKALVQSGFGQISFDFSMGCKESELEELGVKAKLSSSLMGLAKQCQKEGMNISIARAPFLKRDTKRMDLNEHLSVLTEECIRLCGQIGCHVLVVPPLFSGIEKEAVWAVNRECYLRLSKVAAEHDVMLLLENQCKDYNGHLVRGICADEYVAAEWVDMLNQECKEERFGFCMDVGAYTICGQNMYDVALHLGKRVKAVLIRDCDGIKENALLPFTCVNRGQGQTDWLNLIRGLREICFDDHLIFDFSDSVVGFSPLLRPNFYVLAKSVVDFFAWQINIENVLKRHKSVVLFGAGNMCRNYMKCYGEKYPPLFTCDNNEKTWGTMFCGLEVKSPEVLKEIPKDCAIIICNIYYQEIEEQLRNMQITNLIEYFNDEYMPSFYYERLEMAHERT